MRYEVLDKCLGYILGQDIIDEDERLILAAGTPITAQHILRLRHFGIYYLCIDDLNSEDIRLTSFLTRETELQLREAISEYNIDKIFAASEKLVNDILNNTELLSNGFLNLNQYDENTFDHSISVSVFSIMLGFSCGLNLLRLNNLAVGAMMHDIGKMRIPIEILNKEGKLTEKEIALMRRHPEFGYEMIKNDLLIPSSVRAVIYQHHENWDGSGYPRKLREHEIYELASICHICDVFDALISQRSYKKAFSYKESLDYMQSQRGIMFNPYCLDTFFQYVPVFKTGVTVTLNDGRKAIVVKNNKGNMRRPVVRTLEDPEDIDLSQLDGDKLYIQS